MERIRIQMAEEGAAPQIARESAGGRREAAALGALGLLFLWSFGLSLAVLRGPLSVEGFTSGLARFPRPLVIALAASLLAPWIALVFRERSSLVTRGVSVASVAFAVLVGWASTSPPRFAFDLWERRLSSTAGGVPWLALALTIVFAVFAISAALASWRYLLARDAAHGGRTFAAVALSGAIVFVIPTAATIYLATGSRVLPIGEPDELWAPAFSGAACPPASGAAASSPPPGSSSPAAPASSR